MRTRRAIALALTTLIAGCAFQPEWQRLAHTAELESSYVETASFRHRELRNHNAGDVLHIYIEGDGAPWIRENRVSYDPTPTNPVMLRLMIGAGHRALYLGRPCYFGLATSRGCNNRVWTFDRYGPLVIESMCDAANALSAGAESVALIGYSGGGAIVMRMAACTDRLRSVTTIAGNLDPAAWTAYHGYTPLTSDVEYPESPAIAEAHWQCAQDTNVPPEITDAWFAARPTADRHIIDDCTHASGWEAHLPAIIGSLSRNSD